MITQLTEDTWTTFKLNNHLAGGVVVEDHGSVILINIKAYDGPNKDDYLHRIYEIRRKDIMSVTERNPVPQGQQSAPKSELLAPGVEQIPFEGLEAIGQIFSEGEKKYGLDNWKSQPNNTEYNRERTRHAIRHLILWANGDRSEPHLAKVAWFCVTTIWREKQTKHQWNADGTMYNPS
jgi:hypothetical protein